MPVKNLGSIIPSDAAKYNFSRPRTIVCIPITMPDKKVKYAQFLGAKDIESTREALFASLPIYQDIQIKDAPDGEYTWVLLRSDVTMHLYAIKVRDGTELGSKHLDILRRVHAGPAKIAVAAGEFRKTGNTIKYSLASGSVTVQLFDKKPNGSYNEANIKSIAEQAATGFKRLQDAGVDVSVADDLSESYVNKDVTYADLQHYVSLGYRIGFFDTREQCIDGAKAFDGVEVYKNQPHLQRYFPSQRNMYKQRYGATIIGNSNYAGGKRRTQRRTQRRSRTRKMRRV